MDTVKQLSALVLRRVMLDWATDATVCTLCGDAISSDTVGHGESVGWCPKCQSVFYLPIFRVPGWVAGTIVLLSIKVQAGI